MSIGPKHWNILVVDDDPDVLSITKLAIRNFVVEGLPLNIVTAKSKAEAMEILSPEKGWLAQLAVAFVDVVMETDTAGLDLCQHIREELRNRSAQIYVRTGQPGSAPEREVIDQYDISGYLTKAEATEDKLYSIVKSGIRDFSAIQDMAYVQDVLEGMIEVSHSREELLATFATETADLFPPEDAPNDDAAYAAIDGQLIVEPVNWTSETAHALKDRLVEAGGEPLGDAGDQYVIDEDGTLLIHVAAAGDRPEAFILLNYPDPIGLDRILTAHRLLKNLATLWVRAEPLAE